MEWGLQLSDARTALADDLAAAIAAIDDPGEARAFLGDLCTPAEIHALAERWYVARLLDQGDNDLSRNPRRDRRQHDHRGPRRPLPSPGSQWRLSPRARPASRCVMSPDRNRLHLAIQKSGRLSEDSLALLRGAGIRLSRGGKSSLSARADNFPLDLMLVRDDDIPTFVADGVCELGIVGQNVLEEYALGQSERRIEEVARLGFGRCSLKIAAPDSLNFFQLKMLDGQRIATSYPNLLRRFLEANGITADIVTMRGAVELAPRLGIARFICDLVSTGATLDANGLAPVADVFDSEAVLVRSLKPLDAAHQEKATSLLTRIEGVISTAGKQIYRPQCAGVRASGDQRDLARRRGADRRSAGRAARPCRGPGGLPGIGVLGDARAAEGRRRVGHPGHADRKDDAVIRFDWSDPSVRAAALARPRGRADPRHARVGPRRCWTKSAPKAGTRWCATRPRSTARRRNGLRVAPFAACARGGSFRAEAQAAMRLAADQIRTFHQQTMPKPVTVETRPGLSVSKLWRPLDRAGLYVPGGRAPLFSTLMMLAIPAQVAGVRELVVVTPPRAERRARPGGRACRRAVRDRGDLDRWRRAGDRRAGLWRGRHPGGRSHLRARQCLGVRGQGDGLVRHGRTRDRPSGRPERADGPGRTGRRSDDHRRRPAEPGRT